MNDQTPANDFVIFLLSDGTGESVDKITRACLTQFQSQNVQVVRYKSIRAKAQVEAVLDEAKRRGALVVYTAVSREVRDAIAEAVAEKKMPAVDLLGDMIAHLSQHLHAAPTNVPGLLHEVNEQYFKRIEAMEFTVKHDDGNSHDDYHRADLVLVGVSRTSKTPLSIYLSHRGWKVANCPLVKGIDPPKALFEIEQNKIVALTIDAQALAKIRRERLVRMGRDPSSDYASLTHIGDEIEWAMQLYGRNRRWPVFDVTNKALEETASEIEKWMQARAARRAPVAT
jgi:regulator of PEP synthase PpsR (kinase-PPPase family)